MSPWIAAFIALFVWWFSTGAILMVVKYADLTGQAARMRVTLLTFPMSLAGIFGLHHAASDPSIFGVYVGFLSALALWGWIELAFLTGAITGPNTTHLPANTGEGERFLRAWGTIAYHEILLLTALMILIAGTWGAENQFGTWTYLILYLARISAKLNLYLGVPQFQIDFMPDALSHLPSHFRKKALNWLFPVSITALSVAAVLWLGRLFGAETAAEVCGYALLTALTVLALFEHWMMVLPIPDERLWRWMLPAPKHTTRKDLKGGQHGL